MLTFSVGQKYKIHFGENHYRNKIIECRAIVDENWIVYRWCYGDVWQYVIELIASLQLLEKDEILTKEE